MITYKLEKGGGGKIVIKRLGLSKEKEGTIYTVRRYTLDVRHKIF